MNRGDGNLTEITTVCRSFVLKPRLRSPAADPLIGNSERRCAVVVVPDPVALRAFVGAG
jgi:hypothetical protein